MPIVRVEPQGPGPEPAPLARRWALGDALRPLGRSAGSGPAQPQEVSSGARSATGPGVAEQGRGEGRGASGALFRSGGPSSGGFGEFRRAVRRLEERVRAREEKTASEARKHEAEADTWAAEKKHLEVQLRAAEDRASRAERTARDAVGEKDMALTRLESAQKSREAALLRLRTLLNEQAALHGNVQEARARAAEAEAQAQEALARAAVLEAEAKEARVGAARAVEDFQKSAEHREIVASCCVPMAFRGFRVAKRAIAALHPELDLRSVSLSIELLDGMGDQGSESEEEEEDGSGEGEEEASSAGIQEVIGASTLVCVAGEGPRGEPTPIETAEGPDGAEIVAAETAAVGAMSSPQVSGGPAPLAGPVDPASGKMVAPVGEDADVVQSPGGASVAAPRPVESVELLEDWDGPGEP